MMKTRNVLRGALSLAAAIAIGLITLVPAEAAVDEDESKLDQVTLSGSRQFVGNIINETDTTITMEIFFRGIRTTRDFRKSEVLEILHDTIVPETEDSSAEATAEVPEGMSPAEAAADGRRIVHVIPMRGLLGWQMYGRNLEYLWDKAIDAGAKTVILEFDCYDGMRGNVLEEYRDVLQKMKRDAAENEVEIAVWMKGAYGAAVAYALMFNDIFFHPSAIMGKGEDLDESLKEMFSDEAVRAKMISAWVGICRGMAEEGGHDALLCEAMIRPELTLGVRFEGEEAIFNEQPLAEGYTAVDVDTEKAVELDSAHALRYGISKGDATSIEDLMRALRHREYYVYEGESEDFTEDWIQGYEKSWFEYFQLRADIEQIDGWDEEPKRKLGMKLQKLKEIQKLLIRFPPLGVQPFGRSETYDGSLFYGVVDPYQIEMEIEEMKRQMQSIDEQLREQRRSNPGDG